MTILGTTSTFPCSKMKIKLVELSKTFSSKRGNITAVDKVNLEIKDGEFFVMLGPSGCGKSTVLNLIAGLEMPTDGEIWFDNKLVSSNNKLYLTPQERKIGMVFQSYALYPHLSVFENIAFPLRIQRLKENQIKEAVCENASMLEISNLLSAKPNELSGGERQRVAIARAIVRRPNVFLLDEPLSNLDAKLRLSTRIELKNLQRKIGTTTIYVTHDQTEAMTLGDRIAVLKNGRTEQVDTPEKLYEKPINEFVATFVCFPPINLFETELLEENKNFYIVIENVKLPLPENKKQYLKKEFKQAEKGYIFGIRPEHIRINSPNNFSDTAINSPATFKTKINSIEMLGRETILYTSLGKYQLSILTTDKRFKEGDIIDVEFDMNVAHIFPL